MVIEITKKLEQEIFDNLERLRKRDVKNLRLKPGMPHSRIQVGTNLYELDEIHGAEYRGLVVHVNPSGTKFAHIEHVIRENRMETGRTKAICLGITNLGRYDQKTGRINSGSVGAMYFSDLDEEGYNSFVSHLDRLGVREISS